MKLAGKFNGIEIHTSPAIPKDQVIVLNDKIFVDPGQYTDVQSFLKGDEVNNDALLEALTKLGNDHAPTVGPAPGAIQADDNYVDDFDPDDYDEADFGPDEVDVKPKAKKKEKKAKTKTFKADKMANGFVFQANPLAEGKKTFYMEAYLLGNNEIYISGGMAGLLNGDEAKQLRKQLKMLLNQLNESYPNPDTDKGGKTVLKVNAPWAPSDEQLNTVAEMVKKETKKVLEKVQAEVDDQTLEFIQTIALHTAVTTVSQLAYAPHTPTTTKAYDVAPDEHPLFDEIAPIPETLYGATKTAEAPVNPGFPITLDNPNTMYTPLGVMNETVTQEDDELLKAAEELGIGLTPLAVTPKPATNQIDVEAMKKVLADTGDVNLAAAAGLGIAQEDITPEIAPYDFSAPAKGDAVFTGPKIKVNIAEGKASMSIDGETLGGEKKKSKKKLQGFKMNKGAADAALALLNVSDNADVEGKV